MNGSTLKLTDLVTVDYLQKLQDAFADMTGVSSVIVDPEGVLITQQSNFKGFCGVLYNRKDTLCAESTRELVARTRETGKPVVSLCPHVGITTASVPIQVDQLFLGSFLIGQILIDTPSEAVLTKTAKLMGVTLDDVYQMLVAMPTMPMGDFEKLFHFVQSITDAIIELGRKNREMAERDKELREITRRMKVRDMMLSTFIQSSDEAMYVCDFYTGEILMANQAYSEQTGMPLEEIPGKKCWAVNGLSEDHFCAFCPRSSLLDENLQSAQKFTWEYYNKKFGRWLRCKHQAISWGGDRAAHMVTQQDITREHEMREKLEKLAFLDSQTGLPNKNKLIHTIKSDLLNSRFCERSHICFHLPSLRLFSEAYGSTVEDETLKVIIAWLQANNFGDCTLYRLGGEDFCLVLRRAGQMRTEETARIISERFENPWLVNLGDNEFSFIGGISISILHHAPFIRSFQEIINLIGRTVGKARESKGIVLYDEEMDRKSRERLRMQLSLKNCVNRGMRGFSVHYQPIVESATGTWKGLEALCRWTSPKAGIVSPIVFIPEAESLGLITRIGTWVLDSGLHMSKEFGLDTVEGYFLSVNISPIQMMDENFADTVISLLEKYDFPGSCLNLEVTESAEMTFGKFTMSVIEKLRGRGVKLALDDFGTGYSSFNNLKHMPVDFLKTEQEFLIGIEADTYMQYFLYIMSEISHANNMRLIAEGVETIEQLRIVKNNGADLSQGYFFSKPMPVNTLIGMLHHFTNQDPSVITLSAEVINIKQWLSGKSAYELTPALFNLLNQCMQIMLSEKEVGSTFQDVLEITGEHFSVSRAFAFVRNEGTVYSNLYEWCAKGVSQQKHLLMDVDVGKNTRSLLEAFKSDGMVVASDISKLPPDLAAELKPLDLKAVALLPMWDEDNLAGFVGFDMTSFHVWSSEEIVMLWNLAMIMANTLKRESLRKEVGEKSDMLDRVLQTSGLAAFVSDPKTDEILWVNETLKSMAPADQVFVGRPCYEVFYNRAERCVECRKAELLAHPEIEQVAYERYNEQWDRMLMVYESMIPWTGGRRVHIGYAMDLTDRVKMEQQVEYLSSMDMLTGACNRVTVLARLRELTDQAVAGGDPFTLCFINIDSVKRLNIVYGNAMGDRALCGVVKALKACVRSYDIVGRLGGDDFLVILPNCPKSMAKVRMMQARNYLAQADLLPGGQSIAFSHGLADSTEIPSGCVTACMEGLLSTAEQRMLESKESGLEAAG